MPAIDIGFTEAKMANIAPNMEATLSSKRPFQPTQTSDNPFVAIHPPKKRRLCDPKTLFELSQSNKNLDPEDNNDLTNLNWLQDSNLLQNILHPDTLEPNKCSIEASTMEQVTLNKGGDESHKVSLLLSTLSTAKRSMPYRSPHRKPPYSYSALIFMAIESSASKSMMVRDIYKWIVSNFPYFATAPSGWKNTIRHTLSLRKCFKKVDRYPSGSQSDQSSDSDLESGTASDTKGGFWHVDDHFRPSLLQLLERAHHNELPKLMSTTTADAQVPRARCHQRGVWYSETSPLGMVDSPNTTFQWTDDLRNKLVLLPAQRFIQVPVISSFARHCVKPAHNKVDADNARVSPMAVDPDWKTSGDGSYKVRLTFDKLYPVALLEGNSLQSSRRSRNTVSVISVNKAPKVFAPVPMANMKPHFPNRRTTMNDKAILCSATDRKLSSRGMYGCTHNSHKPEHKLVPPALIASNARLTAQSSSQLKAKQKSAQTSGKLSKLRIDSNGLFAESSFVSVQMTEKAKLEDNDDELIRDGAEALLNFASGAFQLNRLLKQED